MKILFDKVWSYIVIFGALVVLSMFSVIKYLSRKNKKLEHENSIFKRVEDIRAEQEIAKRDIIYNEPRAINEKFNEAKKGRKSKRDRVNSL